MMDYKVRHEYENENGWNEEEVFSGSLEECIEEYKHNGGWNSEEDYYYVVDKEGNVVWE